jgi:3-oxoacyl-[acyl-carrier protein] reductase
LSDPVAVITGGEGDFAKKISARLKSSGYIVHAPDRRELDVRSAAAVEAWFSELERVDLLVNNAGITGDALLARQNPEGWGDVTDTNLKGTHLCMQQAAITMMRLHDGHIINIGSYSAFHPPVGQTAYAASKAGLIGLTKSYARELGKRNIRCNCVLPGFLETKMTAKVSEEARVAALKRHALGRFNTVNDAAEFVAFLAKSENISGQVFQLDSRA